MESIKERLQINLPFSFDNVNNGSLIKIHNDRRIFVPFVNTDLINSQTSNPAQVLLPSMSKLQRGFVEILDQGPVEAGDARNVLNADSVPQKLLNKSPQLLGDQEEPIEDDLRFWYSRIDSAAFWTAPLP